MLGSRDYRKETAELLHCKRGSILILVLWVLALLGFLSGEYLSHNRGKSTVSSYAWNSEKEAQAIESVIQLYSTDFLPALGEKTKDGWINLAPGGIHLWAETENEKEKVNINSAPDAKIRAQVRKALGEEKGEEADKITDAILDWRDADSLVRLNGAESGYYEERGFRPANGPLKSLTELLLVRGISSALFWGDPLSAILESPDEEQEEKREPSLVQALTMYDGDVKRVNIVVPAKGNSYVYVLAFLKRAGSRWRPFQIYRTMLLASGGKIHSEAG